MTPDPERTSREVVQNQAAKNDAAEQSGRSEVERSTGGEILRLYAEDIAVSRQSVETGRVRVQRITRERPHVVNELLTNEKVEVERVPVNKRVDTMPAIQTVGDTIIVPVVEEEVVIERRLILKEELHIRKTRTTTPYQEQVTLRSHEAVVTRLPQEPPETK